MISPILSVKNVDASVAFYTQKLGFKHDFSMPGPDGTNTFAFVSLGDNSIGLSQVAELKNAGSGVAFMVYVGDDTDIDQYYNEVKGRGTKIEAEIKTEYWGDRIFTVHDPDGYVITPTKTVKQVPMEEIEAIMRNASQA